MGDGGDGTGAFISAAVQEQTGINMASSKYAAASLHTFLNAKLVNGIDFVLAFMGFYEALSTADLVMTMDPAIPTLAKMPYF